MKKTLMSIVLGAAAMVLMVGGVKAATTDVKPGDNLPEKGDYTLKYGTVYMLDHASDVTIKTTKDEDDIDDWKETTITVKKNLGHKLALVEATEDADTDTTNPRPAGKAWIGFAIQASTIKKSVIYRMDEIDANGNTINQGELLSYDGEFRTLPGLYVGFDKAMLEEAFRNGTSVTKTYKFVWNATKENEYSQIIKLVIDPELVDITPLEGHEDEMAWNDETRIEVLKDMATNKKEETTTPSETNPSEQTPTAPESQETTGNTADVKNPGTSDNFMSLVSLVSASAAGLFIAFKKASLGPNGRRR